VTPVRGYRHQIVIATIVIACAVIYGLAYYVVERPLKVTHEISASGTDPVHELDPISLGRVVGHGVDTLPLCEILIHCLGRCLDL